MHPHAIEAIFTFSPSRILPIFKEDSSSLRKLRGFIEFEGFPLVPRISRYSSFNSPDLSMWLELVDVPWGIVSTHV
jgi:hypothetical protein